MVRHLAAADGMVAAAAWEREVAIWDLVGIRQVAAFTTILDAGGRRLALAGKGALCIAGAYTQHGVACYESSTGSLAWRRTDLKRVQQISVSADGERVFCCFDDRPCVVLDSRSGADITTWRGVRDVVESPFQPWLLHAARALIVRDWIGNTLARIAPESFALLAAAFLPDAVALSESGATLRVVSVPSGKLLWRYQPPPGSHILHLGLHQASGRLFGVEWPYERGGAKSLVAWNAGTGHEEARTTLGEAPEQVFCLDATRLLLSDGAVVDTASGEVLDRLHLLDIATGA